MVDHILKPEQASSVDDARIVKTRAKLRDALLALVAERQFETITVSEIVARAGVGYATFFRRYADKQALWADIADSLTDSLFSRIRPLIQAEDTRGAARALCEFIDARRSVFVSILASGAENTVREDLVRRAAAQAEPLLLPTLVPRDLVLVHAINTTLRILVWWLADHADASVDAVAGLIDRLAIRPLLG